MNNLFVNENLFFMIENGKVLAWNFKSHEQYLLEDKYFNALLVISKTGNYDQKTICDELLAANILTKDQPETNRWGWDNLSRIFHLGTKNDDLINNSDQLNEHFINNYLNECENLDQVPNLFTEKEGKKIILPIPDMEKFQNTSFLTTITNRKTCRKFLSKYISVESLSLILFSSFGLIHGAEWKDFTRKGLKQTGIRKSSPASGGIHSEEAYVVIFRVDNIDSGLYHYDVKNHALTLLSVGNFEQDVIDMNLKQFFSHGLSFGIYITSKFNKSWWKYKHSRAYRAVLMDIGHVSQTFQLCATACELNTWLTGEFIDDKVCTFLNIDEMTENPLLFVGAGYSNGETFPEEMNS